MGDTFAMRRGFVNRKCASFTCALTAAENARAASQVMCQGATGFDHYVDFRRVEYADWLIERGQGAQQYWRPA